MDNSVMQGLYAQMLRDESKKKQTSAVLGIPIRDPFPSELDFFSKNKHIGGMASEDNKVIINPHSKLTDEQKRSVMRNEAARVHMRNQKTPQPEYPMSLEQLGAFSGYGNNNLEAIRQTYAARLLSKDKSAVSPTLEQQEYLKKLVQYLYSIPSLSTQDKLWLDQF